jgi:hypothetical protein
MRWHVRLRDAGLGLSFVVLSGGALALATMGATLPTGAGGAKVSPQQALVGVRRFVLASETLNVSELRPGPRHPYYAVDGANIHANVDAVDGTVATLTMLDRMPTGATISIGREDALALAEKFVDDYDVSVGGLTASARLVDHGSTQDYVVSWTRRINGALVPQKVSVSVNPENGDVFAINQFSRPFEDPPLPIVSLDKAIAAAERLAESRATDVETSDLVVDFDEQGKQLLAWHIAVRTDTGAVLVQVDAVTGGAKVISRG